MSGWDSTLCFRRFRAKLTELSRVHWTHTLGADVIRNSIAGLPPDARALATMPISFKRNMLPLSVTEMSTWIDEYLGRARLHLLLVCAASLEEYVKDITLVYLLAKGYRKSHTELNAMGVALGSPILSKQSLPEPVKYAEHLFGVTYGSALVTWHRSYKLRCALAHNGGVVTARTLRDIPDIGIPMGQPIVLTWDELFSSLSAADEIATITDKKIASRDVKRVEIAKELSYLRDIKQLPSRSAVWKYLHEEFGLSKTKRAFREFVESEFYK